MFEPWGGGWGGMCEPLLICSSYMFEKALVLFKGFEHDIMSKNVKEASESDTFSDFEPLTSGASSLITSEGG